MMMSQLLNIRKQRLCFIFLSKYIRCVNVKVIIIKCTLELIKSHLTTSQQHMVTNKIEHLSVPFIVIINNL